MALNAYIAATQLLLSNPAAPTTLYSTSNITQFVNTARTQLAGETECCRAICQMGITSSTLYVPFSFITGLPSGSNGVFTVRQVTLLSGSGQVYLGSRPYPWAINYWLNNPSPVSGQPTEWAQYGIGNTGSILLNPQPNASYTLSVDAVVLPAALSTDTDPEIIPYAYTDAVPFLAAFYAYMSAQRQQDAQTMYGRYEEYVDRARRAAVPNVLPMQYDQMVPAPPRPQAGGA